MDYIKKIKRGNAMKVLLIKPRTTLNSIFAEGESIMPPIGLLYLGSYLTKKGIKNAIIDFDIDQTPLNKVLKETAPDYVGITFTSKQLGTAVDLAKEIKAWGKDNKKDIKIVIGGIHSTVAGRFVLEKFSCIDYAVRGDGEKPIHNILMGKIKNAGIVYRDSKGKVIDQGLYHENELDSLPFPDRTRIDDSKYNDSPVYHRGEPHTFLLTSRGCCFKCIFCNHSTRGQVKLRSAENVLAEIEEIASQGYKDIRMLDEFFTFDRKRVLTICKEIVKRKIKIQWNCQTRADSLTEEVVYWMRKAGCYNVQLGIEVGSQESMKKIHKNLDLEKVKNAVKILRKNHIFTIGYFMYGFSFEKPKDWEDTLKFSKSIGLSMANSSIATGFPGTDMWYDHYTDADTVNIKLLEKMGYYSTEHSTKLKSLLARSVKAFYFRPWIAIGVLWEGLGHGSLRRRYRFFKLLIGNKAW